MSRSVPGRLHNYALFQRDQTAQRLPLRTHHYVDRGYDGAQTDHPDRQVLVPVKKRRNHRVLTRAERRGNRRLARIRIGVEHVLSRLKKYQVLAQVYRHQIADYNRRFRNVAALTNFRLAPAVA